MLDIGYSIALFRLKPARPKSPSSRRKEFIWKSGKQEVSHLSPIPYSIALSRVSLNGQPGRPRSQGAAPARRTAARLHPAPSDLNIRLEDGRPRPPLITNSDPDFDSDFPLSQLKTQNPKLKTSSLVGYWTFLPVPKSLSSRRQEIIWKSGTSGKKRKY